MLAKVEAVAFANSKMAKAFGFDVFMFAKAEIVAVSHPKIEMILVSLFPCLQKLNLSQFEAQTW